MLFVAYYFTLQYLVDSPNCKRKQRYDCYNTRPDDIKCLPYHTINKQSTRQYHTNQAGEAVTDCERESLIVWLLPLSFTIQLLRCVDTRTVYTVCKVNQSRVIEGPHQ